MTHSSLIPFEYDHNPIRVHIGDNENPWFIASDVCAALGLGNVNKALTRLDADEKKQENCSDVSNTHHLLWMVNESGLYSLTFTSRKPEARGFRRWITSEVLPTLRKTGKYELAPPAQPPSALDALESVVKLMRDHEDRLKRLEDTHEAVVGMPQMMTIVGYVTYRQMRLSETEIASKGKQATAYSNANGYPIEKMGHKRWGFVNVYHIDVLKQVFKQRRLFEGPGGAE